MVWVFWPLRQISLRTDSNTKTADLAVNKSLFIRCFSKICHRLEVFYCTNISHMFSTRQDQSTFDCTTVTNTCLALRCERVFCNLFVFYCAYTGFSFPISFLNPMVTFLTQNNNNKAHSGDHGGASKTSIFK